MLSVNVSYQEEGSIVVMCSMLYVGKCLSSKCTTGDVKGKRQGHVVLGVHKQSQIGAENPSHCHFHLLIIDRIHNQFGLKTALKTKPLASCQFRLCLSASEKGQ